MLCAANSLKAVICSVILKILFRLQFWGRLWYFLPLKQAMYHLSPQKSDNDNDHFLGI